jgi:flagellar basal-body rod protein FlgC
MPGINTVVEMSDMIMANRAYEACVTAFDATKSMALKALELGR